MCSMQVYVKSGALTGCCMLPHIQRQVHLDMSSCQLAARWQVHLDMSSCWELGVDCTFKPPTFSSTSYDQDFCSFTGSSICLCGCRIPPQGPLILLVYNFLNSLVCEYLSKQEQKWKSGNAILNIISSKAREGDKHSLPVSFFQLCSAKTFVVALTPLEEPSCMFLFFISSSSCSKT
jgi:hypothetical protein